MPRTKRARQTQLDKSKKVRNDYEETVQETEVSKSSKSNVVDDSLKENTMLREELETLKAKYAEKKKRIKELTKTAEEQQQKLTQQDQYIMKLKKDRKAAEMVHKNNVSNLITTSAQNQALMAVLTTHQQSAQQLAPPAVFSSIPLQTRQLQPNANVFPCQYSSTIDHLNQMNQHHQIPSYVHPGFNNANPASYYSYPTGNPFQF